MEPHTICETGKTGGAGLLPLAPGVVVLRAVPRKETLPGFHSAPSATVLCTEELKSEMKLEKMIGVGPVLPPALGAHSKAIYSAMEGRTTELGSPPPSRE